MMLDTFIEVESFVAPAGCVTRGNPTILHCFSAHKTSLTDEHRNELDRIGIRIVESHIDGRPIREIRIVGHSAKWRGISAVEYIRRSRARAKSAARYLKRLLQEHRLRARIAISGKGTSDELVPSRPESTSSSARRNRALNRRVEIYFVDHRSKPTPKPRPPKPSGKKKTLNDYLRGIETRVAPHKRCVVGRLLDPKASVEYLPARGVTAFLSTSLRKKGVGDHVDFFFDMREDLAKALTRIHAVPTKTPNETRLLASFEKAYAELFQGIRALKFADCYDKRTPAMRRTMFAMRKNPRSLYSCPALRTTMQNVMKDLAGIDGVKPEYGCAA